MMRVRVSSVQFQLRPITSFDDFAQQVRWAVQVAKDAKAQLLCFPEYLTGALAALTHAQRRAGVQRSAEASSDPLGAWGVWTEPYIELFQRLAKTSGMYIVGGTHLVRKEGVWYNTAHLFTPTGEVHTQSKLHLTPYEMDPWTLATGDTIKVFDTPIGRLAILVCFDVEFPEAARTAVDAGAQILLCPSATDDRAGFWRVRHCCMARAVENQVYVVHSALVGNLPTLPGLEQSYGRSAIISPCDIPFPPDGIVAEGEWNQELVITGDVDLQLLDDVRSQDSVTPALCRRSSYQAEVASV